MYNQQDAGWSGGTASSSEISTPPVPVTLRNLLSEVEEISRKICVQSSTIGDELFGPRPSAEDNGKDPRGDIRACIERIRRNLSNANMDLQRNIGAIRGEDPKVYPNALNQRIGG